MDNHATCSGKRPPQLPNELLHKIIIFSVADAVHTIGTTSVCHWEMNFLVTFYCVSIPFRAISKEIVCRAFDFQRKLFEDADYDLRLLTSMREMLSSLRDIGIRLRNPSEAFDAELPVPVGDSTLNSSALLVSYVLYLSSLSLRETAIMSTAQAFQTTHTAVISALTQSLVLCKRVFPARITERLYDGILSELDLSRCGSAVVQAFNELKDHAASLRVLQPSAEEDGTGPVTAIRYMIHLSLTKVEKAIEIYPHILLNKTTLDHLSLFQLPGVLIGLRNIYTLEIIGDEYNLEERIQEIGQLWKYHCPWFLNHSQLILPGD